MKLKVLNTTPGYAYKKRLAGWRFRTVCLAWTGGWSSQFSNFSKSVKLYILLIDLYRTCKGIACMRINTHIHLYTHLFVVQFLLWA